MCVCSLLFYFNFYLIKFSKTLKLSKYTFNVYTFKVIYCSEVGIKLYVGKWKLVFSIDFYK